MMPTIESQAQRDALIETVKARINQIISDCAAGWTVDREMLIPLQIALTALEDEPEAYRVRHHSEDAGVGTLIHASYKCMFEVRGDFHYTPLYTAPPVPVHNPVIAPSGIPNGTGYASVAISARDEQWYAALREAGYPIAGEDQ